MTIQCLVVAVCTIEKGMAADGTKPASLHPAPPAYAHSCVKQRYLKDPIQIQYSYEFEPADLSNYIFIQPHTNTFPKWP